MTEISAVKSAFEEQIENLLAEFEQRKKLRDTTCSQIALEAFLLAKGKGYKLLWLKAATTLTHYYSDITSEFEKAIQYLQEVVEELDDELDAEQKSEFYRRIGLNHDYLGEPIKSKLAYDDSVRLLENKTDLSETGFLTLARSLFNESIIYGDLGLETLSKEYLRKAFEYFQKANYKPGISRCYISFGIEAYDKKENEKALELYQKAISIAEEINDTPPYCIAMANSGIVYADLAEKEKAIECSVKALERVKNQTNKHFELSIYQLSGRIYQVVKDFEKANELFTTADGIYVEMGKVVDNFELYNYWSETLNALGRHQEAYEKLQRFMKQKDDLHELNKQAELSDATLRFKYEEGKKEQDLLKKKNAEIEEYAHQLEMSNFELKQFAHVASHDMKEPLRMISNYSQLLEKSFNGQLKIDQKDYIYYINDGAKRMMNVIQSLLHLSKINSTQRKETVSLNDALDEVQHLLKPYIEEKNAIIKSALLPEISADKIHMIQLLQNLVTNGIKYNRTKQPVVEIGYSSTEKDHCIEVADNGIGIAKEYRDKVFIIFQRLHNRNEFDGTGIGLSICKKIVDSLNGKIWIEDSPLGGTKFCFTIPK